MRTASFALARAARVMDARSARPVEKELSMAHSARSRASLVAAVPAASSPVAGFVPSLILVPSRVRAAFVCWKRLASLDPFRSKYRAFWHGRGR